MLELDFLAGADNQFAGSIESVGHLLVKQPAGLHVDGDVVLLPRIAHSP